MRNGFRVIDADAHFYEPPDIWDRYVEPAYHDRRPRVKRVHGNVVLEYEGVPMHTGSNSHVLFSQMEAKFGRAFRESWSLESRLADMEQEGWDIQVCLPTNGAGETSKRDPELAAALCRAYNNWARDFCSGAPERVKFTAVVPWENVEDMVTETRRAVDGLEAVSVFLPKAIPRRLVARRELRPDVGGGAGAGLPALDPRRGVRQRPAAGQHPLPGRALVLRPVGGGHQLPIREHDQPGALHLQRPAGPLPPASPAAAGVERGLAAVLAEPPGAATATAGRRSSSTRRGPS